MVVPVSFVLSTAVTSPSGSPRPYSCRQALPSRFTSTRSVSESAFTTETPTPCRPPDTLYPSPPNLPPACSFVSTTSSAGCLLGHDVDGNAAPVVGNGDRVVRVDPHFDGVAVTCERFVDGVVDDFEYEMVKTSRPRRSDVHPGPLADGVEPLQNGYVLRAVTCFRQ